MEYDDFIDLLNGTDLHFQIELDEETDEVVSVNVEVESTTSNAPLVLEFSKSGCLKSIIG